MGRRLTGEEIQSVIAARDRAGDRIHHLRQAIARIEGVGRGGGPAVIGGDTGPIQDIILIGGGLALAINHGGQVAHAVIGGGFRIQQGIFARGRPIPLVVAKDRGLVLRVQHLREIAVIVVGELRDPFNRIGELFHAIHRIVLDQGAIPQRIRDLSDPAHHVAPIGGRAVQMVAHRPEDALFIGKGGRMGQGIGDGQRLPRPIVRDLGSVAEMVHDGGELAPFIIPKSRDMVERIRIGLHLIPVGGVGKGVRDGLRGPGQSCDSLEIAEAVAEAILRAELVLCLVIFVAIHSAAEHAVNEVPRLSALHIGWYPVQGLLAPIFPIHE